MVSLHFCENLDKIAKSGTRGATLARAAGSLWLAGPRQLARAHRLPLVTHPAARSAGLSAGSGNAAPFPLRPGVARHQSRSRRDRGSVASFSITAHSAEPTQSQTTARSTSSSPSGFRRRYFFLRFEPGRGLPGFGRLGSEPGRTYACIGRPRLGT